MQTVPELIVSVLPTLVSRKSREKVTEIAFEKFQTSGFHTTAPSNCSNYSSGCTTAITIEIGDESSSVSSTYEGKP